MEQTFWVAVKSILQNPEGKILILFKSESEDINPSTFDIPWWRIQWGEKLENAIKREVEEEVGLDIEVIKVSRAWGFTKNDLHLVWITFLCLCNDIENLKLSWEHTWYYWLSKDEIINWEYPDWLKTEIISAIE